MTQFQNNGLTLTTTEKLGGVVYEIRVWQTDTGGFAPEAVLSGDALTDWQDQSVYLGGEDDEDDETPEAAIERGRRLLREQFERGNLDA